MEQGIVVAYNVSKGFGFIRASGYPGDVFVHATSIEGGGKLVIGQHVEFEATDSERGPRTVRVIPGKRGLALDAQACQALGVFLIAVPIGLRAIGLSWIASWFATINLATALAYAWDKHCATRDRRRIPEFVLLGLALIGGSPAALLTMLALHHKIRKPRFLIPFGVIVVIQIAAIVLLKR